MQHQRHVASRALLAATLLLATLAGSISLASPAGAGGGPPNDAFAGRYPITGTTATVEGDNGFAGGEPGEPDPSCSNPAFTLWWTWTATFTGQALLDTRGSNVDTTLAVWTGSSIGSLTERACDDDDGPGRTSRVELDVVQGQQYQLQVGAFNSSAANQGNYLLRLNPITFIDVGRTHPFWRDVEWIAAERIADGYPDGGFHPSANISRGAMSAFLYRLASPTYIPPANATFSDVPIGHPFFDEVEWMNVRDITTGYSDGTFKPAASVSRAAMAAFIYRFDEAAFTPPGTATFRDVGTSHPFFIEVEWMNATGITTGYPDGTFRPGSPVTRGAMAAFLHRNEQSGGA